MWFHKTGRFAVGNNGEPSIYIHCSMCRPQSCNTQFRLSSTRARPQIAIISLASSGDKANHFYNLSGQL